MTFVRIVAAGLTYIPLFIVVDGYKGNTHILDSSCFNSYGCTALGLIWLWGQK